MTKYIAFLQLKGGSGKSTLAANLCGFLIEQKKVLAIDTDILQRTLSAWATLYTHKNFKCISISSTYELIEAYRQAENHYDFIITDTSSHINDIMNAALFINDLILIPTSATAPDIWAICDMVKTIEDMENIKQVQ